ncbi:LuxR C-terminal-related transcriptional regulator [Nocardioides sp. W7]|uniref:helix-turn-helix transcriptional regulator n=1 Tax=Nocardioides sp. W7 TaxID=2931390 RepID=UPI001FD49996|nr:LuxR C-terminal-related transcriptional regulator [Nocardioides sp. W7]
MARQSATLMTALGFPRAVDRLYHRVLAQSGRELVSVASSLLLTAEELETQLGPLLEHGIARIEESRLFVANPVEAVGRMLSETAASAARAHAQLDAVAASIPFLTAPAAGPGPGDVSEVLPIDGEISSGGRPVALLSALIGASKGELMWLRPDQFHRPREDAMADVVRKAVAQGRRSRAIYPVRALTDARETLAHRAEVGEELRVLPELPTRMFVIGTTHAILPEPLGFTDEPRTLIRQRGLVDALTLWFESMWDRATPVVGLDHPVARPDLRRFLLQQLASGAQDEQIARRLGVSLRTVRRRVADILTELGADSRFQAGVEAARRGWI